jgi:hypothetical protein
MTSTPCVYSDSDIPSRYVAETLPVAEAATFEEHYFSCARCWQEVQTGTAARVLLTGVQSAPRKTWWFGLAAAVAIGVLALVAIRERAARDIPDVLRGDAQRTVAVVAEREAAQVRVRWRAVARASRYEIAMRSAEGEVLQQKSSAATTIVFDDVSGRDVFICVTAYDSQGEELARSPFVRAPSRGP